MIVHDVGTGRMGAADGSRGAESSARGIGGRPGRDDERRATAPGENGCMRNVDANPGNARIYVRPNASVPGVVERYWEREARAPALRATRGAGAPVCYARGGGGAARPAASSRRSLAATSRCRRARVGHRCSPRGESPRLRE
jgi:hypothetical protein